MKKIFTLLTLMLAMVSTAKAADEVLLHWQFSGTYAGIEQPISVTGGTITPIKIKSSTTKDFSTDKIKGYVDGVPDDMKAAGENCLKCGSGDIGLQLTLTSGTFAAGDKIYICGYNNASAGTSAGAKDISSGITNGADNSHYDVGFATLPELEGDAVYTNTIYIQRENSTCGFAAIKIVRPDQSKKDVTLAFSRSSDTVVEGTSLSNVTFSAFDGENDVTNTILSEVTFTSTNENIATVSNGTITIDTSASGEAKVTATFSGNNTYNSATATYTVTVKPTPVQAVSEKTWVFDNMIGTYTSNVKFDELEIIGVTGSAVTVETNSMTIAGKDFTSRLKFGGTGNKDKRSVHFKVAGDCRISVYAVSGGNELDRPLKIMINDEEVVSEVMDEAKRVDYIYIGNEADVYIYSGKSGINLYSIEVGKTTVPVTIAACGYGTLVSEQALDFESNNYGVTAYIATGMSNGKVQTQEVTKVPANTGLILKGTAGTYEIPVLTGDAEDVSANKMMGSATTATTLAANQGYILYTDGKFHPCNAGDLPAGKAYLNIEASSSKVLDIDIEDPTAITAVESELQTGAVYTLQGVRVSNAAQKGVYIVNGKKVVK